MKNEQEPVWFGIVCLLICLVSGPAIWWLSDHCYLGHTAGCEIYEQRRSQGELHWP